MTDKKRSTLEEIEARREAKRKAAEAAHLEQHALDKEALEALEDEHGPANIIWVEITAPGLPTLIAGRVPTSAEMKRYRFRCRPAKNGKEPDYAEAAEELAAVCRVYPPRNETGDELYRAICEARPGMAVVLGVALLKLGGGVEQGDSKS